MTRSTPIVVGNPLSVSCSQVGATRALGIIIEPEPVARASEAPAPCVASFCASEVTAAPVAADAAGEQLAAQAEPIAGPEHGAADIAGDLRGAAHAEAAHAEAAYESSLDALEQASQTMKAALGEAGTGATALTFKLIEFAQANAKSTLDLAHDYVSVRSVPDAINVQAAYVRRQFGLLTAQAEEFRRMATELTTKTAEPFKAQANRSMQAFRMG